jgi:hypothetical protein
MGPIGCPETSAIDYQSALHNMPEERRPHLQRGGRLQPQNKGVFTDEEIIFVAIY